MAQGGQGQLVCYRPQPPPSPLEVRVYCAQPTALLQSWGCRAGPLGVLSARNGLQPAAGASVLFGTSCPSQFLDRPTSQLPPGGTGFPGAAMPWSGWWEVARQAGQAAPQTAGRRGRAVRMGGRPGRRQPRTSGRQEAVRPVGGVPGLRSRLRTSWAHLEMFDLIECRFTLQK